MSKLVKFMLIAATLVATNAGDLENDPRFPVFTSASEVSNQGGVKEIVN
jgi:hypothetical protein